MPSTVRQSKLKQLEDYKRRMNKKPIGSSSNPFRSGTKNPMGKDRVRDRKIKKISQMMERRESLRQNKKPSLPPKARGTGGVGFRKPTTSKLKIGALSNRKKVNK